MNITLRKDMLIITLSILALDIIVKLIIVNTLDLYESVSVIGDFFKLTYLQNTGAAFSILEGHITFFIFFTMIALGLFTFFYINMNMDDGFYKIGLSLMVGGTLGNFIDRIIRGYVVDMFDFKIFSWDFAVFNIADIALVVGSILFAIGILRDDSL